MRIGPAYWWLNSSLFNFSLNNFTCIIDYQIETKTFLCVSMINEDNKIWNLRLLRFPSFYFSSHNFLEAFYDCCLFTTLCFFSKTVFVWAVAQLVSQLVGNLPAAIYLRFRMRHSEISYFLSTFQLVVTCQLRQNEFRFIWGLNGFQFLCKLLQYCLWFSPSVGLYL